MSSNVNVENFDEMRLGMRKELDRLKKSLSTPKTNQGISLGMSIGGMDELLEMLLKLMEILNSIDYKPVLNVTTPTINMPEVELPDIVVPEIKAPDVYVSPPQVTVNPEVNVDIRAIVDALDNLKYLSDRPNKPLSVRMSDGQKFIKAITALQKATDNLGVVYAGQSGITKDEVTDVTGRSATDYILSGSARLSPKFSAISATNQNSNTIVAAVTGKKIRVTSYVLISDGDVAATFKSSTTSSLTGAMPLTGNTGASSGFNPYGHFETVAGELLNLDLSTTANVYGHIQYIEV